MRRTRHGFTLLEVMLSLALASLVVAGVISLLMLMQSQVRVSEAAFADSQGLFRTQLVVRRAMQTLVAGEPTSDDVEQDPGELDPENDDIDPAMADLRASLEGLVGAADAASILSGRLPASQRLPHFELSWDAAAPGVVVPYLEVVVLESPVPINTEEMGEAEREMTLRDSAAAAFRGVFEVAPDDLDPEQWNFRWTPIDPPLRPMVLLRDIDPESVAWLILPLKRDEKATDPWVTEVYGAYLAEDFPLAVRLVMKTESGARIDWVFESAVAEVTR